MANKFWVATSPALFNSSYWSNSSGGPSGAPVPNASDKVHFNNLGSGSCTLNASIDIAGLDIDPSYPGTINQNGFEITIGGDTVLEGGSFLGGGANIFVSGDLYLNGTNFRSTDQTLSVWGSFYNNGSVFNDNLGTVKSIVGNQYFDPKDTTFNNLQFDRYDPSYSFEWLNSRCAVKGQLGLLGGSLRATFNSAIYSRGDILCSSGFGGWIPFNSSEIIVDGSGIQTFFAEGGIAANLTIQKPNSNHMIVLGSTDIYLNGDLIINDGTFNTNRHNIVMVGSGIEVPAEFPPIAKFSWTTDPVTPRKINFTDLSLYQPTSWDWTWGDGAPNGSTKNPSHTYANLNTYLVKLTATNSLGSDSTTMYVQGIIPPVAPNAQFSWVVDSTNHLGVHFTDLSINNPTSWNWAWGDGSANSTTQNPTHIFPNFDTTYTVTLTASNFLGSDNTSAPVVTGANPTITPHADFTWNLHSGSLLQIDFTDLSLNDPTGWDWTWGDGSVAGTTQNPSHTYSNYYTTYAVTLNARNSAGTDSTVINVLTGHYFNVDFSWGQLPDA